MNIVGIRSGAANHTYICIERDELRRMDFGTQTHSTAVRHILSGNNNNNGMRSNICTHTRNVQDSICSFVERICARNQSIYMYDFPCFAAYTHSPVAVVLFASFRFVFISFSFLLFVLLNSECDYFGFLLSHFN